MRDERGHMREQGMYQRFSSLYDQFMQGAPHDAWYERIRSMMDLSTRRMADVGCGTGILTCRLAGEAAETFGVDASEEMLAVAAERAVASGSRVQWMCQDMRSLRLPRPVDVLVSSCDCINYLLSEEDVERAFRAFRDAVVPGGLLCFDVLGPGRVEQLRKGCFYEIRDGAEIWFASDVFETGEVSYEVHGFVQVDEARSLFERFVEEHRQRFYEFSRLSMLLEQNGFDVQSVDGDFGLSTLEEADRGTFVVVRK